jgi:hypothetical protein
MHADDYFTLGSFIEEGKDWTLREVIEDGYQAFCDFKLLKELAEKIADKVLKRNEEE